MGSPKSLLPIHGETFLDRLIRIFSRVANPVIVVLGANAGEITSRIERADEARFVTNPDPERGMLSSLQCGLEAVPRDMEAALFTPVDHPSVEAATLEKLVDAFEDAGAMVIVPCYNGAHGHPVLIRRPVMADLLKLPPGSPASDVIHRYRAQTRYVAVDDPGVTSDIDDLADYSRLLAANPARSGQQP